MTTYALLGGGITVREELSDYINSAWDNYLQSNDFAIQSEEFCSVYNLVGLVGAIDGQGIQVSSFYNDATAMDVPSGGGYFLWDSTKAKSSHNGVTVISPTVPWVGTQATLSAFIAGTGETNPSGNGCWVRQYQRLDVTMGGAVSDGSTSDVTAFQAVISATPNSGTQYIFVHAGTYAGDFSALSFGSRKVVWVEDGVVTYSGTAPSGTRTPKSYYTLNSIKDLVSRDGLYSGQSVYVKAYYSTTITTIQKGGGWFYWDSTKAKSNHNGITIFSPTVPWTGQVSTLANYHAKTGETDPSGSGCWIRQTEEINPYMAGARGGQADDYVPLQASLTYAIAQGLSWYVPSDTFLTSATLTITDRWSIYGDGDNSRIKCTDQTIALFTFNITSASVYGCSFTDVQLIGPTAASNVASCALRFLGTAALYVNFCRFSGILAQNFYSFAKFEKAGVANEWGVAQRMQFCSWEDIRMFNVSMYGWWYTLGSGTGNVWQNIRCATRLADSAVFFFDGAGCVVGDVIINGVHPGCDDAATGSIGIKVGDNTLYRSRFSITAFQFDANCHRPLVLSSVGSDLYSEWRFNNNSLSGDTLLGNYMTYMAQSEITDREVDLRRVGNRIDSSTVGATTVDCFYLDIDNSATVLVNVTANGTIAGVGGGMFTSDYNFEVRTSSAGAITATELERTLTSTSQLTWTCTQVAVNRAVLTMAYNAPATGSVIHTQVAATGVRHKVTSI